MKICSRDSVDLAFAELDIYLESNQGHVRRDDLRVVEVTIDG